MQTETSREHAILSASGSKKWLVCTPSARLEDTFPNESSEASKEGTKCHDLMEIALRMQFFNEDPPKYPVETREKVSARKEKVSVEFVDLRTEEGRAKAGFTPAMESAVQDLYARIREVTKVLDDEGTAYTVLIESKVNFSKWVPEGFGRLDVTVVTAKKAWIFDLKYGMGVEVDATDNSQMKLYALGIYNDLSFAYEDIEELSINIVQPRIHNFSSWDITVDDLLAWGEQIKPIAQLAWEGKGEFVPGPHCTEGFCRARFTCRARIIHVLTQLPDQETPPATLADAEVAKLIPFFGVAKKWGEQMAEFVETQAVDKGVKYPGYKLVEGKSNRFISDKEKAQQILADHGFAEDQYLVKKDPELIGLGALETLVGGKKTFTEILGEVVAKPKGKATLVPVSDSRPELVAKTDADQDFAG